MTSNTSSERVIVTVGIPVFNGERYLGGALDSLKNQSLDDIRIVIGDNASTDSTESICREAARDDPRIEYHRHERNLGAHRNYNFVLDQADSKYFKWAAHDDICRPRYLEACVEALEDDRESVLAYPNAIHIDEEGEEMRPHEYDGTIDLGSPADRFITYFRAHDYFMPIFGVFRTHVLKSCVPMADFAGSDKILLAEAALRGRFTLVEDYLFLHRQHANSSVNALPNARLRTEWFDPDNAGSPTPVAIKQTLGYLRGIAKSPVGLRDKARSAGEVAKWGLRNARAYGSDVKALITTS